LKRLFLLITLLIIIINMGLTLYAFRDYGFFSKYVTLGNDITREGIIGFSQSFEYSPLYSMFFAFFSLLFKSSFIYYAVLINIISGINAYLLMIISERLFGRVSAIISAVLYALSVPFVVYNTDLLAAPLVILFNLSSILAFLYYKDNPRGKYIFASGLFIGLSAITRPNILIFAVFMALYIIYLDRKHFFYYISAVLICLLPITAINYAKSGELVLVEDSGPAVLYSSNNYSSTGLGYSPPGVLHVLESRYTRDQKFTPDTMKLFKEIAVALHDRPMSIKEINAFYLAETKTQVFGNFSRFLSLSLRRVWYSLHFFADYDVISSLRRGNALKEKPLIPGGILIVLGLSGIIILGRENRKHAFILLYLFSYLAFFSVFYITERLRLPMMIMLIPFSSKALLGFFSVIKRKDAERIIGGLLMAFVLFLMLSYENHDIKYRKEHTKTKFLYLNNIIMAFYEGNTGTIITNAQKILKIDPLYQPAWYYVHSAIHHPDTSPQDKERLQGIIDSFSKSYQTIIDEYRQVLSENIYDLEAIKFVSSFNINYPPESEEFRIVPDMTDVMKMLSPADPEVYYIESGYHARLGDYERALISMKEAVKYGILYSSYYRDSALMASGLFLEAGDRENALKSLNLLKNLFPRDSEFKRFIQEKGLAGELGL